MSSIANFNLAHLLDLTVGVVVAFVLATMIGAERQWRQRSAGLRTNVLVAVGAAAFVSLGVHLNGNAGATRQRCQGKQRECRGNDVAIGIGMREG